MDFNFYGFIGQFSARSDDLPFGQVHNGYLMSLYYDKGQAKKPTSFKAVAKLQEQFTGHQIQQNKVRQYVQRMMVRVESWRKRLHTGNISKLQERAEQVYDIPFTRPAAPTTHVTSASTVHVASAPPLITVQTTLPVTPAPSITQHPTPPVTPFPSSTPHHSIPATPDPSPAQLPTSHFSTPQRPNPPIPQPRTPLHQTTPLTPSRKCVGCLSKRAANKLLAQEVTRLKSIIKHNPINDVREECRKLKQRNNRKEATTNRLRLVRDSLRRQLSRIKPDAGAAGELRTLRIQLGMKERRLAEHSATIKDLETEVARLSENVKSLEAMNDYLLGVVEDGHDKDTTEGDVELQRQPYDSSVRKCIYRAILSQVPVARAGGLVRYVASELGDAPRSSMAPSRSSVARMAHEVTVLSLIQAGDVLMACENATICWDATSISTSHINELHVSTNDRTLTLSIARLPGGCAIDYANHITAALDDVARCYADYKGVNTTSFKAEVIRKMGSTLSDRAIVNHSVVELLKVQLGADLTELHCNLHPLDGFASETRSALRGLDKESELPGRDGAAADFIYRLSVLRYKQKGDPAGFKAFLSKAGIPTGMFPRYVGNRLHVLFRTAGSIIKYLPDLKDYLSKICKCQWARMQLAPLLDDARLLAQFRALGLCGKVITGPWMTLFYSNPQGLSNLEMIPALKTAEQNLGRLLEDPGQVITTSTDVFGGVLQEDLVLQSLRQSDDTTGLLMTYLKTVLSAMLKVFKRQLERYCHGPLSNVSSEVLNKTSSASPNNIWAERSLGMADALMRRAPMATLGFIDAKVKATTNKTLEWLDSKNPEEQERLVAFARKKGAILRRQRVAENRDINNTVQLRMAKAAQARDTKKRRATARMIKSVLEDGDTSNVLFDSLDIIQKQHVRRVILQDESLFGTIFQHTWYDEDHQCNTLYWGRIQERSESKPKEELTVAYWADGQLESTAEDWDVSRKDLLTDMVFNDLIFF